MLCLPGLHVFCLFVWILEAFNCFLHALNPHGSYLSHNLWPFYFWMFEVSKILFLIFGMLVYCLILKKMNM